MGRKRKDETMTWQEITDEAYERIKDMVGNEKRFKEWMMSREKVGYTFDAVLIGKCYQIWQHLQKKNDYVVVIVGREGSGKSTLSFQISSWIDPTFTVDRVHIDPSSFIRSLKNSKAGQAQSLDEGGLALFSRETMSEGNKNLVKIFMTIRMKSLLLTINIPDFGSLDAYVRRHRVHLLIEVLKRGDYKAYFGEAINKVNRDLPKTRSLAGIKLPIPYFWHGSFNDGTGLVDDDAYDVKKLAHVNSFLDSMDKELKERDVKPQYISVKEFARMLGVHHDTVRTWQYEGKLKTIKAGKRVLIPLTIAQKIMKEGIK